MVDLGDDGEALPALEALDDPHLPERLGAVELLGHDAAREALQLLRVARPREARVPDVVVDVEVRVVPPHRVALDRGPGEDLAVAGDEMQARGYVVADTVDVDAAVGPPERARLVGGGARHMHVVGRALGDEERVVEEAQPVVSVGAHGGPPSGRRIPSAPPASCKTARRGPVLAPGRRAAACWRA